MNKPLSSCCQSPLCVAGHTTHFYACEKCKQAVPDEDWAATPKEVKPCERCDGDTENHYCGCNAELTDEECEVHNGHCQNCI